MRKKKSRKQKIAVSIRNYHHPKTFVRLKEQVEKIGTCIVTQLNNRDDNSYLKKNIAVSLDDKYVVVFEERDQLGEEQENEKETGKVVITTNAVFLGFRYDNQKAFYLVKLVGEEEE